MGIARLGGGIWRWTKQKVVSLTHLHDRPHTIALGVASGTFFGFIPLFGFKTLLAMGFAKLFRGNIIAAAIAVTLHDLILPLAPVMLRWEYQFGYWLLSHPHHLPASLSASELRGGIAFSWASLYRIGLPLMLGSVIVAIPFTLGAYYFALEWLKRHHAKKESGRLIVIPGEVSETGKKNVIISVTADPQKTQPIELP